MSEEEKKENELLNNSPVEEGDKETESSVTENVQEEPIIRVEAPLPKSEAKSMEATEESLSDKAEAVEEAVSNQLEEVKEAVSDKVEAAAEKTANSAETVTNSVESLGEKAEELIHESAEKAKEAVPAKIATRRTSSFFFHSPFNN